MARVLRRSKHPRAWAPGHLSTLAALFAPPVLFVGCLAIACTSSPEHAWIGSPARWPWQLWGLIVAGTVATLGGVGDWRFHRRWVTVGPAEHRSHLLALATGGLPLFALMATASVSARPLAWVIPIVVVALYTAVLIAYDEFVYHRRRGCDPVEVLFHRMLVFGNTTAWLLWLHWCLERGARGPIG